MEVWFGALGDFGEQRKLGDGQDFALDVLDVGAPVRAVRERRPETKGEDLLGECLNVSGGVLGRDADEDEETMGDGRYRVGINGLYPREGGREGKGGGGGR